MSLENIENIDSRQLQATSLYNYVGCYGDKATRALPTFLGTGMTSIVQCYNLAVAAKLPSFGLAAGRDCYGTMLFQDASRYGACPLLPTSPPSIGTVPLCT